MSQSAIDAQLEAEFAAVAANSGCELVHVDFRQGRLRVFLDRPQGVTIDDCQTVSKQLSALLDVSDFGDRRYFLEVSSPGLDRELYSPKDYERFRGQQVRVTFFAGEPRTQKTIVGQLEKFHSDAADVRILEASGTRHEIALQDIKVARLEPEL